MPAIVDPGDIQQLDYAWALKVSGAAAGAVEIAAYGAGYAILIYLAYIDEEVTVLSAAVIQFFKHLSNLRVMGSEVSGAKEPKASRSGLAENKCAYAVLVTIPKYETRTYRLEAVPWASRFYAVARSSLRRP